MRTFPLLFPLQRRGLNVLAGLDEISNDSLKEEGFVLSHGSGSHHGHRAQLLQLLWGLCV